MGKKSMLRYEGDIDLAHQLAEFFNKSSPAILYAEKEVNLLYERLKSDEQIGEEITKKLFLRIALGKEFSKKDVRKGHSQKLEYVVRFLRSRGHEIGAFELGNFLQKKYPGAYAVSGGERPYVGGKREMEAIGRKIKRFPKSK